MCCLIPAVICTCRGYTFFITRSRPSKTDDNTKPHVERSEGMGKSADQDVWRRRRRIKDLSEPCFIKTILPHTVALIALDVGLGIIICLRRT